MFEAKGLGLILGYKLNVNMQSINHLQFADDILIIGENSDKNVYKNVWAIKAIQQLFELASGLKVNFHKSRLVGIHTWIAR